MSKANIFLVDAEPVAEGDNLVTAGIYLYTRYKSVEWPERLRQALASEHARKRARDPQYLARIIVDQMFSDYRDTDGGGISTRLGDNVFPILVVDLTSQSVHWAKAGEERLRDKWFGSMSFDEFVAQDVAKYPRDAVASILKPEALEKYAR